MKQNRAVIIISIALLLTVFSLVSLLHYASRKEVISRFQEQQLLHAHHIAQQIETFFQGYALVLKSFSTPISLQHESMDQLRQDLKAYSQDMKKDSVREIFLYDASGRTISKVAVITCLPLHGEILFSRKNLNVGIFLRKNRDIPT